MILEPGKVANMKQQQEEEEQQQHQRY